MERHMCIIYGCRGAMPSPWKPARRDPRPWRLGPGSNGNRASGGRASLSLQTSPRSPGKMHMDQRRALSLGVFDVTIVRVVHVYRLHTMAQLVCCTNTTGGIGKPCQSRWLEWLAKGHRGSTPASMSSGLISARGTCGGRGQCLGLGFGRGTTMIAMCTATGAPV